MTETTEKERVEKEPKAAESALERTDERQEEQNAGREKEGSSLSRWLLYLVLAPVLYVLSIGPTIFVVAKLGLEDKGRWFEVFYAPLSWLMRNWSPFADIIRWYIRLFIK